MWRVCLLLTVYLTHGMLCKSTDKLGKCHSTQVRIRSETPGAATAQTHSGHRFCVVLFRLVLSAVRGLFQPLCGCVGRWPCGLSETEKSAVLDDVTRTWNVTDETLEGPGIQAIVNCTQEGDTILLKTTTPVKPTECIVIPWKLTITGSASNMEGETVTMTCPDGDGLFLLR